MKELLLIGTTVLAIATGSVNAGLAYGESQNVTQNIRNDHTSSSIMHHAQLKAKAQQEILNEIRLQANREKIAAVVKKLRSHVGKTWYVFSGASPSGWDCSGLTMWFYEQLDVKLEHRASKQDTAGEKVSKPNPGDIVVFHYKGNKDAYHVGIYIGNGKMIHAPKHGHLTRIEDVKSFGGNYSDITYRRIIETL
jgi:cell wall-associated NlpC family hydrolase